MTDKRQPWERTRTEPKARDKLARLEARAVHTAPGGEVWLDHATALEFLDECAAQGMEAPTVIGIEAFEFGSDSVKPRMDLIWVAHPDQSRGPWQDFHKQSLQWARSFLIDRVPRHLAVTLATYSFDDWRRDSGERAVLAFRAWLLANGFRSVEHSAGVSSEREILRRGAILFDLHQEYGEFWQIGISTVGLCDRRYGQRYLGPEELSQVWRVLPPVQRTADDWQSAADWFKTHLSFLEGTFATTPLSDIARGLHVHGPHDPIPCPNRAAMS